MTAARRVAWPDGAHLAFSIAEAARRLGCTAAAVSKACRVDGEGLRLRWVPRQRPAGSASGMRGARVDA